MAAHLSKSVMNHLSLMASGHAKLQTTITEQDKLLKNFELSNERLQQRTVKLNQALETVKQNATTLQRKLSKRDESLTQHLKSLQQQLAEETKRSKSDNAKLARIVKQRLLEEKREKEKGHHKYPVPGVVVLVIVSVFLLYVVIQPLKGQCTDVDRNGNHDQSGSSKHPVVCTCTCTLPPLNYSTLTDCDVTMTVCSIEGGEWYGLPFCTNVGDCNVKFVVDSGTKNGHLMLDECDRLAQS
jgi:hypothetical protein